VPLLLVLIILLAAKTLSVVLFVLARRESDEAVGCKEIISEESIRVELNPTLPVAGADTVGLGSDGGGMTNLSVGMVEVSFTILPATFEVSFFVTCEEFISVLIVSPFFFRDESPFFTTVSFTCVPVTCPWATVLKPPARDAKKIRKKVIGFK